jgi:hypothetical protein
MQKDFDSGKDFASALTGFSLGLVAGAVDAQKT